MKKPENWFDLKEKIGYIQDFYKLKIIYKDKNWSEINEDYDQYFYGKLDKSDVFEKWEKIDVMVSKEKWKEWWKTIMYIKKLWSYNTNYYDYNNFLNFTWTIISSEIEHKLDIAYSQNRFFVKNKYWTEIEKLIRENQQNTIDSASLNLSSLAVLKVLNWKAVLDSLIIWWKRYE